jgi:hypothetical protein
MGEGGGWLWLLVDVLVLFAAALIYGTIMWCHRRKDRSMLQTRDAVTRAHYRSGNG